MAYIDPSTVSRQTLPVLIQKSNFSQHLTHIEPVPKTYQGIETDEMFDTIKQNFGMQFLDTEMTREDSLGSETKKRKLKDKLGVL